MSFHSFLHRSLFSTSLRSEDAGTGNSSGITVNQPSLADNLPELDKSARRKRKKTKRAANARQAENSETVSDNEVFGPNTEQLNKFQERIYARFHENKVVCAVCDEICCESQTEIFTESTFPVNMFNLLMAPSTEHLHPQLLSQYSVASHFPDDQRFRTLLLSPRGVELNVQVGPHSSCSAGLRICHQAGCVSALKRNVIPKFSIANGNWIGQLPPSLRPMSYGTRCLLRPVQSFGRITTFTSSKCPTGGSRLTGHVYSVKLNRQIVKTSVPFDTKDSPVRVLVISPFASDASAAYQAKIAQAKSDYIIEPEKIRGTVRFWKHVGNSVMANVELDERALRNLPNDEASTDVFLIDSSSGKKESATEQETEEDQQFIPLDGGPSLLRTNAEEQQATMISAVVSVANEQSEFDRLNEDHHPFWNENRSSAAENNAPQSSSNTYVVRPGNEFCSDSDTNYLEKHYPDHFPYGRGGFGENHPTKISRKTLVAHLLKLSTRQFQNVDFCLPLYNVLSRMESTTSVRIRSNLPSTIQRNDGTHVSKGEAYGRVPPEDLKKAGEYAKACAKAAKSGNRFPPPPTSMSGLAQNFFTDMKLCSQPMQHTDSAANFNRQCVYAAHNSNGKAQIWLTVSPDDALSYRVVWYALGPESAAPLKNVVPDASFRFELLVNHPVAAALHFEDILNLIIEDVIGWDQKKGEAKEEGGIFGRPRAYVRVVEEQSRLTLHTHILIWIHGHEDIGQQLIDAEQLDEQTQETPNLSTPTTQLDSTNDDNNVRHRFSGPKASAILKQFGNYISNIISGELHFPPEEMDYITKCPNETCSGRLAVRDSKVLEAMRRRSKNKTEEKVLSCASCGTRSTITDRIAAGFRYGHERLLPSSQSRSLDVNQIRWNGLENNVSSNAVGHTSDVWHLKCAAVQHAVNQHDWMHRASCFKNNRNICRYEIPRTPVNETKIVPISENESDTNEAPENIERKPRLPQLDILIRKREPFILMTDFNPILMSVLNCNNCTKYVVNQKVSLYYGAYTAKRANDCNKALTEAIRSVTNYLNKIKKEEESDAAPTSSTPIEHIQTEPGVTPRRSDYAKGMGALLSATRAYTNNEVIGAPLAAFALRGNRIFEMSHDTAVLPLEQAAAFLENRPLQAAFRKDGTVTANIHDYVFRNHALEATNYWQFVATQESTALRSMVDEEEPTMDEEESPRNGRFIHKFMEGHPRFHIMGHRKRIHNAWPRYLGKRVLDYNAL